MSQSGDFKVPPLRWVDIGNKAFALRQQFGLHTRAFVPVVDLIERILDNELGLIKFQVGSHQEMGMAEGYTCPDGEFIMLREQVGKKGYAVGFKGLLSFLDTVLPRNEIISSAVRKDVAMYPDLALRELIANTLIHQDFTITGAGPMVEVFDSRVEVFNPGAPLGDIDRLLDQPPRSRNEALASFMRRIGICEERGSGVDKVVHESEVFQLPPPKWEISGNGFRAMLFAHKDLTDMDQDDKIRACYLHACLRYVMREQLSNSSLRSRFGIEEKNSSIASRIIRDALNAGVIKEYDPNQGKRNARYVPFWA